MCAHHYRPKAHHFRPSIGDGSAVGERPELGRRGRRAVACARIECASSQSRMWRTGALARTHAPAASPQGA
jgi:hypothetical protein